MTDIEPLPLPLVNPAVNAALREDLGLAGDITTQACIPASKIVNGSIKARSNGVIAGIDLARAAFEKTGVSGCIDVNRLDGAVVAPGDCVINLTGSAQAILTAERVALNYLGHLSGIATATNNLVTAVEGTKARIACTRKTTPGLRAFEKHAVRAGGGINHRFGLFDAVMIKDNHIVAAGGIRAALEAVRRRVGHTVKIEIEVDTLDQLDDALAGGPDIILLDNMKPDALHQAVQKINGRAIVEASGNVTVATVRAIAETGVDVISSGWITHSAPTLDLGLDLDLTIRP